MSLKITNDCIALQMPSTCKLVLIILSHYANDDGICWPSVESIGNGTSLSRSAVIKAIKWLEASGVLIADRTRARVRSILYRISPEAFNSDYQGDKTRRADPKNRRPPSHCYQTKAVDHRQIKLDYTQQSWPETCDQAPEKHPIPTPAPAPSQVQNQPNVSNKHPEIEQTEGVYETPLGCSVDTNRVFRAHPNSNELPKNIDDTNDDRDISIHLAREQKSQSSSEGSGFSEPRREVQISVMLRRQGANVQPHQPYVINWAKDGFTDQQLCEAMATAKAQRQRAGDSSPVNAGYLDKILRSPKPQASQKPLSSTERTLRTFDLMFGDLIRRSTQHVNEVDDERTITIN